MQTRDYYVRQLHDWKGSADVETMRVPRRHAATRGCAAGRSRARTRGAATGSPIASYLGRGDAFDRAIADFAAAYADQNERDYQALVDAVGSGRIEAQTGL